jgi:hypothetical protein
MSSRHMSLLPRAALCRDREHFWQNHFRHKKSHATVPLRVADRYCYSAFNNNYKKQSLLILYITFTVHYILFVTNKSHLNKMSAVHRHKLIKTTGYAT